TRTNVSTKCSKLLFSFSDFSPVLFCIKYRIKHTIFHYGILWIELCPSLDSWCDSWDSSGFTFDLAFTSK
uniref:Uncharacterized protein n=1 Tax=Amphimedon queenslandica TaxID=400682 RepID=A0A1X7TZK6_AMPQE